MVDLVREEQIRSEVPKIFELSYEALLIADGEHGVRLRRETGGRETYQVASIEVGLPSGNHFLVMGVWDEGSGEPVGHIDWRLDEENKRAYLVASPLSYLDNDQREALPDRFKELVGKFEPPKAGGWEIVLDDRVVNAMEVKKDHRGKGLGTLLFAGSKLVLEARGIEQVWIEDDQTRTGGKEGFYKRHGAVLRRIEAKVVQVSPTRVNEYEEKMLGEFVRT